MLSIIGLVYALCALSAGSPHPDQWSGFVQAVMLVIGGSTILMNLENDIARNLRGMRPAPHRAARMRRAA